MKDIYAMNYDELVAFRDEINKEINKQYNERKKDAWLIVVNAIKMYCEKYEAIEIISDNGDSYYFDDTWNFSTIGEIK